MLIGIGSFVTLCAMWYFWVERFHTQQFLKMKHLEIHSNWFPLISWWNWGPRCLMWSCRFPQRCMLMHLVKQPGPQTSSSQFANRWKEQRRRQGTKQRVFPFNCWKNTWHPLFKCILTVRNTNEGGPNPQKNILKSFCVCVSLLLNFNLKDMDAPPEFVKIWHLGTAFATSQRAPINRHWASAVTTTISPCCKASIWGSSSCRAHQLLNTSTTSRIQNPQHGKQTPSTIFWPSLYCWPTHALPPTSALPISQHCLAERPALHSARRARPMQPCPATASCGRSWTQPAPSTGSSCNARCSPPNQDTTGLLTS